jgi:hypothetical protein
MLKWILIVIALIVVFFLVALQLLDWKARTSSAQSDFAKGTIPSPVLDGLYKGSVKYIKVSWVGKKLMAETKSGINLFRDDKGIETTAFPFATLEGKSITDPDLNVLKLDYNQPGNPWWLSYILDEVVQVGPDSYLGKVDAVIFGHAWTLGFFTLTK